MVRAAKVLLTYAGHPEAMLKAKFNHSDLEPLDMVIEEQIWTKFIIEGIAVYLNSDMEQSDPQHSLWRSSILTSCMSPQP